MRTTKNELLVDLNVSMFINERHVNARGISSGVPGSGNISAKLNAENKSGFNLGILAYVLLTGQPSMSFVREGAVNPFRETGGVYKAVRELSLNKGYGNLRTEYSISKSAQGLDADFRITGKLDLPPLKTIAPTIETWVPHGAGEILGHFTMCWKSDEGEIIKGEADTHYVIPIDMALPDVQFREILIDFSADERFLEQKERIVLFTGKLLKKWTMLNRPEENVSPELVKAG